MTSHDFPFQSGCPAATLTLMPPDPTAPPAAVRREMFWVDTGFSDYIQLDWTTFTALGLQHYTLGTVQSQLADNSVVIDIAASVRVLIPECGVDTVLRCISNAAYGSDLRLIGSRLLEDLHAVIDYPRGTTTLSD